MSKPMDLYTVRLTETTDYGSETANGISRSTKVMTVYAPSLENARLQALEHYNKTYPERTYEAR